MNIEELLKLRVMYDEDNECWAINDNDFSLITDEIIAERLGVIFKKYFNLLINNGGFDIFKNETFVGFETKEIAEQCLQAIKNYKQDDIIEKVGENPIMRFKYKNWQGKTSIRNVKPIELWYGDTNYHKENQWFMKAYDIDKCSERDFAMMDIIEYIKMEER